MVGMHQIEIELTDLSRNRKVENQKIEFTLSLESATCGFKISTVEPIPEPFYGDERVTAEIEDMSPYGIVIVEFNTLMKTDHLNLTDINSTIMDVYIMPSDNWHMFDS